MRTRKKVLVFLLLFAMLFALAPVSTIQAAGTKTVTVTVRKKAKTVKRTLTQGTKLKLQVKDGSKKIKASKASFKSSDKKIAAVSKSGVITAKKAGTAKITVRYNKKSVIVSCKVVKKASPAATPTPDPGSGTPTPSPTATPAPEQFEFGGTVEKSGIFEITAPYKNYGSSSFYLVTKETINADDVEIIVNNGQSEAEGDVSELYRLYYPTTPLCYEYQDDPVQDVQTYYVPSWNYRTRQANVSTTITDHGISVSVSCWNMQDASVPVTIYYKGELINETVLKTSAAGAAEMLEDFPILVNNYNDRLSIRLYEEASAATWTDSMTVPEKITAIAHYIGDHCTYEEVDCKIGADILWYAVKDLGLMPWYVYTDHINEDHIPDFATEKFYSDLGFAGHTIIAFLMPGESEPYCCGTNGDQEST